MLKRLHLHNFRGFKDYSVPFSGRTILVGKNNAGKSTVVEALRLISIVVERYRHLAYDYPPKWLELPKINRGVSPSLKNLEITFESIFHKLGLPPARIVAEFVDGEKIDLYLGGPDRIYAIIFDSEGKMVSNKSQAARFSLPEVRTLPPISPLQRAERVLEPAYVKASYSTSLASLHFRNQLRINYDQFFTRFALLAESSWKNLHIENYDGRDSPIDEPLNFFVRDSGFVAEAGWLGDGLQMWLQIMWFLSSVPEEATVILDEPDVYMHVEQQRTLVRLLRDAYHQVIISTHSTEILAEVGPDEIVIVDRARRKSDFASSLPAVQTIIDQMGGTNNLQLMKLWAARRFLLVEGEDVAILKYFHNILFPRSSEPIDSLPNMAYEGWGGWHFAVGSSMLLHNAAGDEMKTYCIMDRDYHTDDEVAARYSEASKRGIQLHVWERKEIENYFLRPSVVQRLISSDSSGAGLPSLDQVTANFKRLADELQNSTFDAIAEAYLARNKGLGSGNANAFARERMKSAELTLDGLLGIVSGKEMLAKLSSWCKLEFGISFGLSRLSKYMDLADILPEVREVIRAVENGHDFPHPREFPGTNPLFMNDFMKKFRTHTT